jgi:hypothetical protein
MRRLGRHIAPARRAQAIKHLLQQRQDGDDLVALLRWHVEPEPGQGLIQFLSGHLALLYNIGTRLLRFARNAGKFVIARNAAA